jgi:prefoldin subunit 5
VEKPDEYTEKRVKKYKWNMQEQCNSIKRLNQHILSIEEEVQAKGMENIFKKILTEYFLNLK